MTLRINDTAPDFEAGTTQDRFCFHESIANSWCVLFGGFEAWRTAGLFCMPVSDRY
jgi:alkyl hydroperoxide reductase subunit AhpC